ncbi:EthD domain-containing protein [Parahaliea sp. F7430]|uniref:EthD domain-containing protein n=1 Tax=Sediminihaliea albiluteola TaxID=2758564 RepID=A0A7W2TXJ0_9GAMM|nr:DUF4286 family protein [Sediminihaliea albiluteola]MBA6413776.1 EthD domain-containing protein [Sediminihaliea albiluteola]
MTDNKSLLVVQTNALAGRDEEFNRWYNEVHIPEVLALHGFTACRRYTLSQAQLSEDLPQKYLALYEITGDPQKAVDDLNAAFDAMTISEAFDQSSASYFLVDPIASFK